MPSSPSLKRRRLAALAGAARRVAISFEARSLVKAIQERASVEEWSVREISRRIGIPRTTLARLARGEGNLGFWIPRLRATVARLNNLQP